jgi:hypothetical protein
MSKRAATPEPINAEPKRAKVEEAPTKAELEKQFEELVRKIVGPTRFNYGWTMHGPIKWGQWAAPFLEWLKYHPLSVSIPDATSGQLAAFFAHRAKLYHYGSFELQIVLDALLHSEGIFAEPSKRTKDALHSIKELEPSVPTKNLERHAQNGVGFVRHYYRDSESTSEKVVAAMDLRYHNPLRESYFFD